MPDWTKDQSDDSHPKKWIRNDTEENPQCLSL